MKFLYTLIFFLFLALPVSAQTLHQELQETVHAEVTRILSENVRVVPGTETEVVVQEVEVEIKGGERKGERVQFETDLMVLEEGDSIYVNRLVSISGVEYFEFKDADRRMTLMMLTIVFMAVLFATTGVHGVRAFLSLIMSIAALWFILVPLLLKGYSPALVTIGVSGVVLACALFLTYGIRAHSLIAFSGTLGAITISGILTLIAVETANLTGLSSDAAIYLNLSTNGALDFGGLLLGGVVVGMLGILDDVSITQAAVVRELKRANPFLSFFGLYRGALRVGRDHISALVNTLSFAYIGVSLPLILLLAQASSDLVLSINQEMVAVELIRMLVGSLGLMLTVPLTTLVASFWYARHTVDAHEDEVHHMGHSH